MTDDVSLSWRFRYLIECLLGRALHAVSNRLWANKLVTRLLLLMLCCSYDLQILLSRLDGLSVSGLLSRNNSSHLDLHLFEIVDKFVLALVLDLAHLLSNLLL